MALAIRSRRDLDHYITAFNNNDIEIYSAYYAPDAQIALGGFILRGKEEILAFFKNARKQILEHIDPIHVIISENVIALKAMITFTTIVDLNEPFHDIGPPVFRGGGYRAPFVIFYELDKNGQFRIIDAGRTEPAVVKNPRPDVKL